MKTDRKKLYDALSTLAKIVDKKSSLQILRTVKMRASKDRLWLRTTDLRRTLTTDFPCSGSRIDVCIDVDRLLKAIKPETGAKKSSDSVEITMDSTDSGISVVIVVDGMKIRVKGMDPSEYPSAPDAAGWKTALSVDSAKFAANLAYLIPAISTDSTRPHIGSLSILKDGRMAATDGHRLHVAPLQCGAESDILIPRDAAITLSAILKSGKDLLVDVREEQASFSVGDICLVTSMPQTQFPPIDQVIPEKNSNVFVNSSKLLKAIRKLDSLQNAHDATIIETTDLGVLRLSFEDSDNGATEVEISATFADSASRKIGANSTYLIDALIADCEADISIRGPLDPIRIDCDSYIAVVMPMRI